jgi:hypothetical protein
MAQIMFVKNPSGPVSLGAFLLGVSAFLVSVVDPEFGSIATVCIVGGMIAAPLLAMRHRRMLLLEPRLIQLAAEKAPRIPPR